MIQVVYIDTKVPDDPGETEKKNELAVLFGSDNLLRRYIYGPSFDADMYELDNCGFYNHNGVEIPVITASADEEGLLTDIEYQFYKPEGGVACLNIKLGEDSFIIDSGRSKKFLAKAIKCRKVILVCEYIDPPREFYEEIEVKQTPEEDDEAPLVKTIMDLETETINWFQQMLDAMRTGRTPRGRVQRFG